MVTSNIDLDAMRQNQPQQPMLPFPGNELDRSGIRLTRAELARLLEVSKQAVGDWVKSGKIVLGADGRIDPRQAVSQLLRSTDPARLRSKVLAPLVKDVGKYQQRIAELESNLVEAEEAQEFAEDSVIELFAVIDSLEMHLRAEWEYLCALDAVTATAAISAWIGQARMYTAAVNLEILHYVPAGDESEPVPPGAPENMEGAEVNADDLHAGELAEPDWAWLDKEMNNE